MTRKIFLNTLLVGLSVLFLCAVVFFGLQYTQTKDETRAALRQEAVYAANGIALSGEEYLRTLDNSHRITWIAADGHVLYDSEFGDAVGNQAHLSEVRDAFRDGEGYGIRRSESTGAATMYCAVRCGDGTVLRLSRTLGAVRYALVTVSPVLWMVVLVLFVSGVLAFRVAKQILVPVNAIDLDAPDAGKIYPELAPLVGRIEEQNLTIREREEELGRKQKEFSALTDSMQEGFLLLDRNGTVLSANHAASSVMSGCGEGESFLEQASPEREAVREAAESALKGTRREILLSDEDGAVQLIANPVSSGGRLSGAVILTLDVTEREQREKLRREFSANVSHELKTPLTSISGFAELLMRGMVPAEKTAEFAGDIYRESRRMIALVDDIIRLSRLDEQGGETPAMESIDLYEAAEGALESVRPAAEKEKIALRLTGDRAEIRGVRRILEEMIFNLCDNAVKYNKPGGEVEVNVAEGPENVVLTVRDTGIGIPRAHQSRVFERFYRVDKSHSREIGGTGLGLSIVKHGAMLHGASIGLESEPGEGTTVTLTFPRERGADAG